MLDPIVFCVPKPFGLVVEMVDESYPMSIPGDDADADVRLLREVAAARRALSMALLAISTAADDCHIEEEESFMVTVLLSSLDIIYSGNYL